jgi:uncharacterized membrane protein (Fun14 family)
MLSFKFAIYYLLQTAKRLWNLVDLHAWALKIGGAHAEAVLAAFYFVIAFVAGYFLRCRLKFLVGSLFVTFCVIKVLEAHNLVRVDWQSLYVACGMGPNGDVGVLFTTWFLWVKAHILLFVTTIVGFVVGAKLG